MFKKFLLKFNKILTLGAVFTLFFMFSAHAYAAINTFTGSVNSNYNNSGNWSLAAVPLAGDGNVTTFSNLSPNCTVNAISAANAVDFTGGTGYTNTITMTVALTVSGAITLNGAMNFAGTASLTAFATATLTSNGKTVPTLGFGGTSQTYTLADNWSVSGLLTFGASTALTINGNSITTAGGITSFAPGSAGTTNLVVTGGTITASAGVIKNNLELKGNVTFAAVVNLYNTGTLLYTSGTIVTTGSTLSITGSATLNTAGITWNNITMGATVVTNNSILTVNGTFNFLTTTAVNGSDVVINGSLTSTGSNLYSGTSLFILAGTGSLNSVSGGIFRFNLTINTAGTITLGSNVRYDTGTLTYTAGTVITTSNTLVLSANVILNTNGIIWNNVNQSTIGITTTLTSNLTVSRLLNATSTAASHTGFTTANGSGIILTATGTQDLPFVNFTNIDASGGQTLWSYKGTLSGTTNINNFTSTYPTTSYSFVE